MQPFGEAPAYSSAAVARVAVLTIVSGLALFFVSIADLGLSLVSGLWPLGLGIVDFVFGVVLLVRWIEARDGMTDVVPRVRLYDAQHERGAYLVGLALSLLGAWIAVAWLTWPGVGPWHVLPLGLSITAALAYLVLWTRRVTA